MIRESNGENPLEAAAKRLERAAQNLEQRVAQRLAAPRGEEGPPFDQDRAKLAAELDEARARERRLEEAGAEASAALGRAIVEIRSALNGATPADAREG
jgi:hypothetical protein